MTPNEIVRARLRAMLRHGLQQLHHQLGRVGWRDRTDRRCARRVAAEGHMPAGKSGVSAQPNVSRHGIEMERGTAIDDDGDFRPQRAGEGSGGEPLAQRSSEAVSIDCLVRARGRRADR